MKAKDSVTQSMKEKSFKLFKFSAKTLLAVKFLFWEQNGKKSTSFFLSHLQVVQQKLTLTMVIDVEKSKSERERKHTLGPNPEKKSQVFAYTLQFLPSIDYWLCQNKTLYICFFLLNEVYGWRYQNSGAKQRVNNCKCVCVCVFALIGK